MVQTRRAKVRATAERHLPGEEGTWIFILGDMTVFALLFGVYVEARSKDPALFDNQQELLNKNFGAINTLLLLCSSLLVVSAIRALRSQRHRNLAPALIGAAFAVGGVGFTVMKALEWNDKIGHDLTPATNDFWMYYYILTGLHFFHLLLGMGVLMFLFFQARKPSLNERQFAFVEGGACFWHMVDLLWIVLFPLLYLVR
jgi:nitric oxide reductase NorE protein